MKIAYLILAHQNPGHLKRLIHALSTENAEFFIHVDRKSDMGMFSGIQGTNIHFIQERTAVYWGDYSQVDATLILMRTALAQAPDARRLVLMSGADYPLRTAAAIERYFGEHEQTEFISLSKMPSEAERKFMSRLTTYRVRSTLPRAMRGVMRILMKVGVVPTERDHVPFFGPLVPYAGSQWWALTRDACEYIVAFAQKETRFVNFFKNTLCPDEGFFHTILGSSAFRAKARRTLTYADWSGGGSSPANMGEKHLAFFKDHTSFPDTDSLGPGEMLFARKFSDQDGGLLARMDAQKDGA